MSLLLRFWIKAVFKFPAAPRFFWGPPRSIANRCDHSHLVSRTKSAADECGTYGTLRGRDCGWPATHVWYAVAHLLYVGASSWVA